MEADLKQKKKSQFRSRKKILQDEFRKNIQPEENGISNRPLSSTFISPPTGTRSARRVQGSRAGPGPTRQLQATARLRPGFIPQPSGAPCLSRDVRPIHQMMTATDSEGDLGNYIVDELTRRCGLQFSDTAKLRRLPATWRIMELEGKELSLGAIAHGCTLPEVVEFCVSLLRLPLRTGNYFFDVAHGRGHFSRLENGVHIRFETSGVSMSIVPHGDGIAVGFTPRQLA